MNSWFCEQRVIWMIESLVIFGALKRVHLQRKFKISNATAANDFAELNRVAPGAIAYNKRSKQHELVRCRECKCHWWDPCEGFMGEGCHWVAPDLCSGCAS